jgi:hypothetical protein
VGLLAAVWGMYLGGAMVAGAGVRLGPEWAVLFPLAPMLIVMVTAAVHWRRDGSVLLARPALLSPHFIRAWDSSFINSLSYSRNV